MTRLNRIIVGDAQTSLATLPDGFVDCVVTSPPYFRLRDYQQNGQLGLEGHVDEWVEGLRRTMGEVHRALSPTGTVWLNVGDTYSTGDEGAEPKSLLLGPERLALALLADGWTIRNRVVWAKRNPMPTSVGDRFSCGHETILLLTKQRTYFFDLDGVRVPHLSRRPASRSERPAWSIPGEWRGPNMGSNGGLDHYKKAGLPGHPLGKNPGDVWLLATAGYRGPHHAVFPDTIPDRAIRAGCPEKRCSRCRTPWTRGRTNRREHLAVLGEIRPGCDCDAHAERGVVLDPFIGSGTTAVAAERLGRRWLGIEINPAFAVLAEARIESARESARTEKHAA